MATVTLEYKSKHIVDSFALNGLTVENVKASLSPQEERYTIRPITGTLSAYKRIFRDLEFLHGVRTEVNANGTFTMSIQRASREFIGCGNCSKPIEEAIAKDPNGVQKVYLSFGKGEDGYIVTNMQECAHILIAGTTGSGKSCLMNSLIMQILCFSNADLLLIDPKNGAEFGLYEQDVHGRIWKIAKSTPEAIETLSYAVNVMEKRYLQSGNSYQKNYDGNRLIVVIDELSDLMDTSKGEVEEYIRRISQKGRAAGVHLIVATQSPYTFIITGAIKNCLPTKICLKTSNQIQSRLIIDVGKGAELLDKGDGLVKLPSSPYLQRVQCCYISDKEIIDNITRRTN
ncbi:MAG: FtsK/SpoIIIE domain-containing protein [Roseburia sp.]|nr:FtsK/SpoIIIE domain-containing protein [Roseburia sp.]